MKYSFLLLGLFFCCSSFGQRREKLQKNKFNSEKFKPYEVELKKKWFDSTRLQFCDDAEFVDIRADKSKLGFIRTGDANEFFNLKFGEETGAYINSRLVNMIRPKLKTGNTIKIVIKHFWLSQLIVRGALVKKIFLGDSKGFLSYCFFSCDYYLHRGDELQYAGKLDTVFYFRKWMGHSTADLAKNAVETAIEVGDSLAAKPQAGSLSFKDKQFTDTINAMYNFPILATNAPKQGIYVRYTDFLNNTPLEGTFELVSKKGEENIMAQGIDTSITNNAWGYCNDEGIFKHINDEYYRMTRVQNTFEMSGPREIKKTYTTGENFFIIGVNTFLGGMLGGAGSIFQMLSDKSIMNELVPYQLNIRTGTYY